MALIHPGGPSWAYCSHNLPADLNPATLGVACAAGASNTDGTAVTLLTALAHDVEFLTLRFSYAGPPTVSRNHNALMDLLIDPAGGTSWSTLIADLIGGGVNTISFPSTGAAAAPVCGYDFPIWIPAGASLGLQARAASADPPTFMVYALARGGNRNPASWWAGQRVSTINAVPANSNGGTHTPGSSGSFSSWANFGSTLDAACGALQWGVGCEDDGSWTVLSYQFEFGVGGQRIGPPVFRHTGGDERGLWLPTGPIFHQLAAGTQLQVRAAASSTGSGAMGVTAYAVH